MKIVGAHDYYDGYPNTEVRTCAVCESPLHEESYEGMIDHLLEYHKLTEFGQYGDPSYYGDMLQRQRVLR